MAKIKTVNETGVLDIKGGKITLFYESASILKGEVSLPFTPSSCTATINEVSMTPYNQVTQLVIKIETNKVIIKAVGGGFVSGHTLSTNYIAIN